MQRNVYIALFVIVLLIACVGGFLGGRVLFQRMQSDFALRDETVTPSAGGGTAIARADTPAPPPTEPLAATEGPQPTRTVLVVPAPVTDQPPVLNLTPEPTWTAGVALPTSDFSLPTPTPEFLPIDGTPFVTDTFSLTPLPSATPIGAFPFSARPVRYTSGDCPGTYALGIVTDRGGNPLPNVRLNLVDEFGNAGTAVTKPGPGDTGRYDFPMSGPPRRFYLSIVDESGRALSPRVEILHELPPQEGKGCRWVDWRRN
jgi:hypothetical protein